MDYKDLQINDWVYLSESTKYAMQVSSIDKYECSLDFEGNDGDPFLAIYGEGGIAPIPLTEEMMEMNVDTDDFTWWETESGEGETVQMRAVMTHCVNVVCCDFRFVHEFQHALRLLGYNDIADNFKIK